MITIRDASVSVVAAELRRDAIAFRKAQTANIRAAGNIVRREQRALLQSGWGPEIRGRDTGRIGKSGRAIMKQSRLLSAHRVVIRSKNARGATFFGNFVEWTALVGPTPRGPAFYGKFAELGTKHRFTKRGFDRGVQEADPWMGPSIDRTESKVEAKLGESFNAFGIVR